MLPASVATFSGFHPDLLTFFAELQAHNSREWFADHREQYERLLLEPARAFVLAIGELLPHLGSGFHAEPRVHGSIFAINRDTRFSQDKTPYKTYLDLWFWHGDGPSRERPGYFFRLGAESLMLGAGMHAFSAEGVLDRYRQAVLDSERGERLEHAAAACGLVQMGGRTYARVPRGFPADHPRADWLRHSGLFAENTQPVPPETFTSILPELCLAEFQRFRPILEWLVELLPE
jgi:uncharacterized protein (TIGR02453 family)